MTKVFINILVAFTLNMPQALTQDFSYYMVHDRHVKIYKEKDTLSEVLVTLNPKSVVYRIVEVGPFYKVTYDKIVGYLKSNDIHSKTSLTHYEIVIKEKNHKENNFADSIKIYKNKLFGKLMDNQIYINYSKLIHSYISLGYEIEFINTYKKRIKYITFNIQAYNRVDDKIDITKSKRYVGPIEKNDIFIASSNDIWLSNHDVVEYIKIKSIDIQFMDNTILKNIKYKFTNDAMKFNLINYKLYSEKINLPQY
jgi:hypothetical protein